MSSVSTLTVTEQDHDPILEGLQEELIEAVEQGPEAVERMLAAWCERYPDREDAFRNEARAILLLWGLREPERLGQYQLLDVLTTGGMGKLYRAKEDVTGRIVVVKTILAGHLSPPGQVERFETERRLLSRLHDTHIVPLLATGREGYLLYLVMPFISGVRLRSMILSLAGRDPGAERLPTFDALFAAASKVESRKRMDATRAPAVVPDPADPAPSGRDRRPADYFRRVAAMMEHVALAVHHIHGARIVHRDLKPSNIMIESSGHAWVIDIGLGRELDRVDDDGPASIPSPGRTDYGMTQGIGTLAYMAPEQLGPLCGSAGPTGPARHDARTDVWGLGATLYELLALRLPFSGRTAEEVARKIVSEPPARLNGGIPRELKAICLKALGKAPAERYASASELAADLRRWLDLRPTLAGESAVRCKAGRWPAGPWVGMRRLGFWSRRRPAAAFALGLLTALLLVGILGAKAQLAAAQRELDLAALQRLRTSSHWNGWLEDVWTKVRALRGAGFDPPLLQALAAASLEGIDAKFRKTFPRAFQQVAFDPRANRLLMHAYQPEPKGRPTSLTALWDGDTDTVVLEKDLGPGVIAFRDDGMPLQLSGDQDDLAVLTLFDVTTSRPLHQFRSPRTGPSAITASTLSRTGRHLAVVARPVRKEPDGKLVPDGQATTLAVWDAVSAALVCALDHKATVDLVLSLDGRLLAAWDDAGEITVWLLPEGRVLTRFHASRARVNCVAFGRDPVWHDPPATGLPPWQLAVGDSGSLVTVWDLFVNQPRSQCRGSIIEIHALDFSPDGAFLASAGRGEVRLWDVATGNNLLKIRKDGWYAVLYAVVIAPDGKRLAIANSPLSFGKPSVDVVDIEQGRGIRTLFGLQGKLEIVAVSPDGRLVAAVSNDWRVGIWDRVSGRLRAVIEVPVGYFVDNTAVAFDSEGHRFAWSAGHQARLWDLENGRLLGRWELPEGLGQGLAFHGKDRLLLVRAETRSGKNPPFSHIKPRDDPRVCRLYDLLGPTPTKAFREIADFDQWNHMIAVSPDAAYFLLEGVGTVDGRPERLLQVYRGPDGNLLGSVSTRRPRGADAFIARGDPQGRVFGLQVDRDGRFTLLDLPRLKPRVVTERPVCCVGPGGTRWGVLEHLPSDQLTLALYDENQPEQPYVRILVERVPVSFRFTPDGQSVVWCNGDGTVSVCDLKAVNQRLSEIQLGW